MTTLPLSRHLPLIGMTIIRILTGWFIFRYGRELFQIDGLLDFLKTKNLPFPIFLGYAAKIIELVGGIFLMIGLFTRWVTPLLIVVLCGVIYTTTQGSIFDAELPILFILLFTVFLINGAGQWSIDHLIENRRKLKRNQI